MDQIHKKWLGTKLGEHCVTHLINHRFDAHLVQTPQAAVNLILDWTAPFERFGFGGSDTINALGIKERLKDMGKRIFDHNEEGLSFETSLEYRKKQSNCDCFLCSANALSQTGEIVNMDGIGNRINAMTFGPKKVIIVAGINKVTQDLDSAIRRIREVAAPMRAKSLGADTPCALTGRCADCNAPMRICNITSILHRKPMLTDISIIVVNEEMGY
ncbi:MAG: lactate utilization protein [Proteobacteria bacterium]|nr:lactate utilization protein [Pseudomonadota bacterium]